MTHDEIHDMQNVIQKRHSKWEKVQLDEVEPVCPYVSVGADDPDVGEALALLAQLRHARDVRVVAREELHLRGRPRHLLDRGGHLDVHLDGHFGGRRGKWNLVKGTINLARKCYGFNFSTCKGGNKVDSKMVKRDAKIFHSDRNCTSSLLFSCALKLPFLV